jgi:hypothetical protein
LRNLLLIGGNPPKLPTAKVQFYTEPISYGGYPGPGSRRDETMLVSQSLAFAPQRDSSEKRKESAVHAPVSVLTAKAASGTSSTTFSIPRKVTILADNKPHKVSC